MGKHFFNLDDGNYTRFTYNGQMELTYEVGYLSIGIGFTCQQSPIQIVTGPDVEQLC